MNAGFDEESEDELEEEEEFYDDDELLKKCVNKILKDKRFLTANDLNTAQLGLEVSLLIKIFLVLVLKFYVFILFVFKLNFNINRLISMSTIRELSVRLSNMMNTKYTGMLLINLSR